MAGRHGFVSDSRLAAVFLNCLVLCLSSFVGRTDGAQGASEFYLRQRLVRTQSELVSTLQDALPGDDIVLVPGDYRGGLGFSKSGTLTKPIRLRGLIESSPPIIRGGAECLKMSRVQHVVLQDLVFDGGSGNGVNIDDGGTADSPSRFITLRRVKIVNSGAAGNDDGLKMSGVQNFLIEDCLIEKWGQQGQGMDLVGCHRGRVTGCGFDGKGTSSLGFQAKGGSSQILLEDSRFTGIVDRNIQIGGVTAPSLHRPRFQRVEAREITVKSCQCFGGDTSIAFVNSDAVVVEECLLMRPTEWFFRILQEGGGPSVTYIPCRNGLISRNSCIWQAQELAAFVRTTSGVDTQSFVFERNSWYCEDQPWSSEPRGIPSPVVDDAYGVDPRISQSSNTEFAPLITHNATTLGLLLVGLFLSWWIGGSGRDLSRTGTAGGERVWRHALLAISMLFVYAQLSPVNWGDGSSMGEWPLSIPEWRVEYEERLNRIALGFVAVFLGLFAQAARSTIRLSRRFTRVWIPWILMSGFVVLIESLQHFAPCRLRVASWWDGLILLVGVTVGTICFVLCRVQIQEDFSAWTRRQKGRSGILVKEIWAAATILAICTFPLEWAIDARALGGKLQSGLVNLSLMPKGGEEWWKIILTSVAMVPLSAVVATIIPAARFSILTFVRRSLGVVLLSFMSQVLSFATRTGCFSAATFGLSSLIGIGVIVLSSERWCDSTRTTAPELVRRSNGQTRAEIRQNKTVLPNSTEQIEGSEGHHIAISTPAFVFSLAVLLLLMTIYGSLMPFNYVPRPWEDLAARFLQTPYLSLSVYQRADWVANILLYVPLSMCLTGVGVAISRDVVVRGLWALVAIGIGTLTALGVEFLQIQFPPRTVSQNDIIAEVIGTLVGAVVGVSCMPAILRWSQKARAAATPAVVLDSLLAVYVFWLIVYSCMPLDIVTSWGELSEKSNSGRLSLGWDLALMTPMEVTLKVAGLLLMGVPVGWWVARAAGKNWRPLDRAFGGITFAAIAEGVQVVVFSRYASLLDAAVMSAGVLGGIWWVSLWSAGRVKPLPLFSDISIPRVTIASVALAVYALGVAVLFLWPLEFDASLVTPERLLGMLSPPLAALYWSSEFQALTVVMRNLMLGAPLGFLAAEIGIVVSRLLKQRPGFYLACLGTTAFAVIVEMSQAFVPGAVVDSTGSVLLMMGAFTGVGIRYWLELVSNRWSPKPQATPREVGVTFVGAVAVCVLLPYSAATFVKQFRQSGLTQLAIPEEPPFQVEGAIRPRVRAIQVPDDPVACQIWGAIGTDQRGEIWFGVSKSGPAPLSADLFHWRPNRGAPQLVFSALEELKKAGVVRQGEGQQKIHTRIVTGLDGYLYFASMDEEGEKSDGSRLPHWGSHLWRYDPTKNTFQHLGHVPEGLIAAAASGRWIYYLGLFDHVLYQWDTSTRELKSVTVGSVGGHISRNFLADRVGNVYVPRLRYTGLPDQSPGIPTSESPNVIVELVQFDSDLQALAHWPLPDYLSKSQWECHGITAWCELSESVLAFTTSTGCLFTIDLSEPSRKPRLERLGFIHPEGSAYSASLFALDSGRYVAAAVSQPKRQYDWVVYNVEKRFAHAAPLFLPPVVKGTDLLLYGSMTKDFAGRLYLVGTKYLNSPILLQLDLSGEPDEKSPLPLK